MFEFNYAIYGGGNDGDNRGLYVRNKNAAFGNFKWFFPFNHRKTYDSVVFKTACRLVQRDVCNAVFGYDNDADHEHSVKKPNRLQ